MRVLCLNLTLASARGLLAIASVLCLVSGCANVLELGVERTPISRPSLEATVVAMAADNARLATQVAQLSTAAAPVPPPASTTATASSETGVARGTTTPTMEIPAVASAAPTLVAPVSPVPDTPTPVITATPSPTGPAAHIAVATANLRSGPGTAYPVIDRVGAGRSLPLLQRNQAGDWLLVSWKGGTAWLAASVAEFNVAVTDLPIATVAPEPPPSPAPSRVPSPTAVTSPVAPSCDTVPIRGFGKVWGEHPDVAARLGCPAGWPVPGEVGTESSAQRFEHGLMLWLAEDSQQGVDPVYVLFEGGEFQRFPDLGPADPAVVGPIDPGFEAPGPRFSKVYWEGTGARVEERLGRAITAQVDSPGAYQQFNNGRMFWNQALGRIFVLFDLWTYSRPGQPGQHVMNWVDFEDTFGQ